MHVDDVILPASEHLPHLASEPAPDRYAGQRTVAVNGDALADSNHIGRIPCAIEIRRDDVDVVPSKPCLTRKKMDMLADTAEMWVVILGDLRDSQSVHGGEARNAAARSLFGCPWADRACLTAHSPPPPDAMGASRMMTLSTLTDGNRLTRVPMTPVTSATQSSSVICGPGDSGGGSAPGCSSD